MAPAAVKHISYIKRRWRTGSVEREAWSYRIRLDDGQLIRRSGYVTKADAQLAAQLAAQEVRQPRAASSSMARSLWQLMDIYLAEGTGHLRESSRFAEECDIKTLKRIIGEDVRTSELSPSRALAVWESFIKHRRAEGISIIRLRRELGCLPRAAGWATRRGIIASNPFTGMKRPKATEVAPKSLTIHEARRLLSSAEGEVRTFVGLCLLAGLRRNEALHLPWAHIDMDKGIIHIRNHEHHVTKSGRARAVGINGQLLTILHEQRQRHPEARWVFPSVTGEDSPRRSIRGALEAAFERAGVKGSAHVLRHTFCTLAAAHGAPVHAIQQAAGHASLSVTQTYMRAAGRMVNEAASFIPDMMESAPTPSPSAPHDLGADMPSAVIVDVIGNGQLAAES